MGLGYHENHLWLAYSYWMGGEREEMGRVAARSDVFMRRSLFCARVMTPRFLPSGSSSNPASNQAILCRTTSDRARQSALVSASRFRHGADTCRRPSEQRSSRARAYIPPSRRVSSSSLSNASFPNLAAYVSRISSLNLPAMRKISPVFSSALMPCKCASHTGSISA